VVGNAKQTAHYYSTAFGMTLVAYRGRRPATRPRRVRDDLGGARFVFTGAVHAAAEGATRHAAHGDGVADIALEVPTSTPPTSTRWRTGATGLSEPADLSDEHGTVRIARIATYGDTAAHADRPVPLRRRRSCPASSPHADRGPVPAIASGAQPSASSRRSTTWSATSSSAGWTSGSTFYQRFMGFTNMAEFVGDDIATDYSALMSKVVANGNHRVKFPLNEPAIGKKKSQIDEFLEFYGGPAPSTSRSPPTTSCATSTPCAPTASSSWTRRTPTTTTRSCAPASARSGCRSRS
jgi:4-hydroxyphenylpyruvate dioxygenase